MSRKLWIVYAILAVDTIVIGLLTGNFPLTMGFAVVTAGIGYAAFLVQS